MDELAVERPDLERFTRRIARCSKRFAARFSPIELEAVIAYALQVEQDADRLRSRLTTLATLEHIPSTHGGAESFLTCEIRGCRENAAALAGGEGEA